MPSFNQPEGFVDDRQCFEAEIIDFQEPRRFDPVLVELRHHLFFLVFVSRFPFRWFLFVKVDFIRELPDLGFNLVRNIERDLLFERPIGDHDRACVHRNVPGPAFQSTGILQQLTVFRSTFGILPELLDFAQCFFKRRTGPAGHKLRKAVDNRKRHLEHPAGIADGCFRTERTDGYNFGHTFITVFFNGILENFLLADGREINIDIGH